MDGAGRLARSLRSLRPQADLKAAAIGAAVLLREWLVAKFAAAKFKKRAAVKPRFQREPHPHRVIAFMERYLPNRVGVAATVLILLGSTGFGIVKGGHVEELTSALSDTRNALANSAGFRITSVAINGRKQLTQDEVLAIGGVNGRSWPAESQCLDRRRNGPEALSGPAPDRYCRAVSLRVVAAGWPLVGHSGG